MGNDYTLECNLAIRKDDSSRDEEVETPRGQRKGRLRSYRITSVSLPQYQQHN